MNFSAIVSDLSRAIMGWPLMIYVVTVSIICSFFFKWIQFRFFFKAWKVTLGGSGKESETSGDMTPIQAFINTLSSNLGNGSVAGVATAVYAGGPGSAFWVVFFGFLMMAVRFAEVYISTLYGARAAKSSVLGGPMLYLKHVIGGKFLSYIYAFFCLLFGLISGNGIQANSIRLSLQTTWGVPAHISAVALLLFILYVVYGGASRIVKASDAIVPIKVAVFFLSALAILLYHYNSIASAVSLIFSSAFHSTAFVGGVTGFTVMQAIRYGMARSIFATESGLGSAAILFGFTGSKDPMSSGLMGMISTFVSTLVCFIVALCIVASGVWSTGLNSTALTIAAYSTVFGKFGGWIVSFLSLAFGIGVMVSYAYIVRAVWLFLTNGKYTFVFTLLYCFASLGGALLDVETIWDLSNIAIGGMLLINLFAIVLLLPRISKDVQASISAKQ